MFFRDDMKCKILYERRVMIVRKVVFIVREIMRDIREVM